MSDMWTAALISASWVLLAIGISYGKDAAKLVWTMRKRRKAKPLLVVNGWPCDTLPVCESWIGREITLPVHVEAERIAEYAWNVWEASPAKESNDEHH
jgi:hypothetical protein